MVVKYQDDYWLYHGERNGELLMLTHLSTGQVIEAAPRDAEIMKTKQQLTQVLESLQEREGNVKR